MRYGTLVLGLMSFVGMVSSITVLKTSDHSTQKSLTLFVEKIEAGRHSRVLQAASKSASLYSQIFLRLLFARGVLPFDMET